MRHICWTLALDAEVDPVCGKEAEPEGPEHHRDVNHKPVGVITSSSRPHITTVASHITTVASRITTVVSKEAEPEGP